MSEKVIETLGNMFRAMRERRFSIYSDVGISLAVGSFCPMQERLKACKQVTKVVQESATEQEAMDRLLSKEDQELLAKQVARNKSEGYLPPDGFWVGRLKIELPEQKTEL